jgi:hypothetical protein
VKSLYKWNISKDKEVYIGQDLNALIKGPITDENLELDIITILTTAPKIKGVSHFEHTHTQKKKHGKAL